MTVREEDRSLYRRRSSVRTIRECITVNKRSLYINSGAAERIALHTRSVCFETRADNDWLRSLRNLETRYLFTLADLREEGCVIKNDAREHGIAYRLENWKNMPRNHVICFVPRIFLQTSPFTAFFLYQYLISTLGYQAAYYKYIAEIHTFPSRIHFQEWLIGFLINRIRVYP